MNNDAKYEDMINNVINCDCYKAIKNIPDKSIDLVYIDIPYLIESGGTGKSEIAKRIHKLNYETLKDIRNGIDYSILDELCRVSKYIYMYIWCSKEQIYDIMTYFKERKEDININILVWCKTNPTPMTNNTLLPDIEYCLLIKEKNSQIFNDGYELKSKWYVSPINTKDKDLYNHPTIKPLELVKRHILHSTQPNDIVLDCFAGSGTTGVACKETNRRYILMEIDKEYYRIAKNRLNGILANGQETIFTNFDE